MGNQGARSPFFARGRARPPRSSPRAFREAALPRSSNVLEAPWGSTASTQRLGALRRWPQSDKPACRPHAPWSDRRFPRWSSHFRSIGATGHGGPAVSGLRRSWRPGQRRTGIRPSGCPGYRDQSVRRPGVQLRAAHPQSRGPPARREPQVVCAYMLTSRKLPDSQRVSAENQLAIRRRIEVQCLVHELQFLVHGEFPARTRIAGAPDDLLAAKLFVDRLEERVCVAIWILLGQRELIWLRGTHPYLRKPFQPEHFSEFGPRVSRAEVRLASLIEIGRA